MISQNLTQKQSLKILPQQIQLLNLFQLTQQELQLRIQNELEENPFLEKEENNDTESIDKFDKNAAQDFQDWEEYGYDDIPDYKLEYNNYLPDSDLVNVPMRASVDFRQEAKEQLQLLNVDEETLIYADYLIDSLSEDGLLEQSLEDISDDYSFSSHKMVTAEDFEKSLKVVQSLDPVGLGARSICECLLLQLERRTKKSVVDKLAIKLLCDHYKLLSTAQFEKIRDLLKVDEDEFKIIVEHISKLKTKPIAAQSDAFNAKQTIVPDYSVYRVDDELIVSLHNQYSQNLHVNAAWSERIEMDKTSNKSERQYMKSKLASAQWFISAIKQRESNMLKVIRTIVDFQRDYFMEGDIRALKPMILKNIAEKLDIEIATVSRLTSNKFVDTHFGIIPLKNLFTEGIINGNGDAVSNKLIQSTIQELISLENKNNPYTDQQIVAILTNKGMPVARRTVTKYREQMQIPMSQMRRLWA
jgi:RNA polymerase sigma-54 factor